ncbi:MAG: hypothetical protein WDA10_04330 [Porticoccaceae bacterium]|jgi:hypothetical protein|nr:hypothetical protein [Porticoccaceae bacterium]MEA3301366.1 hypothetical protein [Pseudomonadota bacterium]HLS98020.1 hypothetical protein [Porticoccaceae bacterium]
MAPFKRFATALLAATLAGCGLLPEGKQDDSYVGWYCRDNPETGIKDCEKRLMRNGKPINSVVYERLGAPPAEARPAAPQPGVHPGYDRSPVTTINSLDDGGGLTVENQGPPPRKARNYVDRSGAAAPSPSDNGEL